MCFVFTFFVFPSFAVCPRTNYRENRRKSAEEFKRKRESEIRKLEKQGTPGDVDFQRMIRRFRKFEMPAAQPHEDTGPLKINVVVRKRPVNDREIANKDFDSVSCSNPCAYVHNCKLKVDGITKALSNVPFVLDHAFDEDVSNDQVYNHTARNLVEFAVNGGRATCFAYGQTGSGKTYTMSGVQSLAARDIFKLVNSPEHKDKGLEVHCAFFELYGGRCMDLLHDRRVCSIREDGKGRVQVEGLGEIVVSDESELLELVERGMGFRTTHATEMNDDSSRSHAICQIAFRKLSARDGSEPFGKLSLIDLAGSERGQDTKHHNRQRRQESAEINKSLLALKECIRALDNSSGHVPYRGSKLTMVLKDSFSANSRTVMISCISPVSSSSDHTLNTLRYADRVKEKVARPEPTRRTASTGSNDKAGATDPSYDSSDLSDFEDSKREDEEAAVIPVARAKADKRLQQQQVPRRAAVKAPPVPVLAKRVASPRNSAPSPSPRNRNSSSSSSSSSTSRLNEAAPVSKIPAPSRKQWEDPAKAQQSDRRREPLASRSVAPAPRPSGNLQPAKRLPSPKKKKAPAPVNDTTKPAPHLESYYGAKDLAAEVKQLIDLEEDLLNAHMKSVQRNADLLTEEGVLLSKVQGDDLIDYDIEGYAKELDDLLTAKLKMITNLQDKVKHFRQVYATQNC